MRRLLARLRVRRSVNRGRRCRHQGPPVVQTFDWYDDTGTHFCWWERLCPTCGDVLEFRDLRAFLPGA